MCPEVELDDADAISTRRDGDEMLDGLDLHHLTLEQQTQAPPWRFRRRG